MAKFFNQKVKKGKKSNTSSTSKTVIFVVIGVIIVIFAGVLLTVYAKNNHKDVSVKLREKIAIEINNKDVNQDLFFEKLENVKEKDIKINYDKVVFDKVGTYDVTITIYNRKYYSKIEIVDTESPVLETKSHKINVGESYKASDFVESCKDNSDKDCIIEFYDGALNQNGEKVDYRNFTKEGHYDLEIVASDEAGNKTSPQKATLTIGKNDTYKPITCNYGNGEYDETNIIAVNVTNSGCAIDLNLYDNEEVLAPVNKIKDSEKEKLKKEFSKINLGVKNIYINTDITTVLNTAGKGVVGYTLKVTVSIKNNNKEEVIEEYYVNLNGGREYIINKYL